MSAFFSFNCFSSFTRFQVFYENLSSKRRQKKDRYLSQINDRYFKVSFTILSYICLTFVIFSPCKTVRYFVTEIGLIFLFHNSNTPFNGTSIFSYVMLIGGFDSCKYSIQMEFVQSSCCFQCRNLLTDSNFFFSLLLLMLITAYSV